MNCRRMRFAVLKLSKRNLLFLSQLVQEAGKDFRDVLVAAGFGKDLETHLDWLPPERDGT